MLFREQHQQAIRKGLKTATRRTWKKPMVKMFGTYPVQLKMFQPRDKCDIIKVTALYQQPLREMDEEDAYKEGGYTLEQFKRVWEDIVGPWDPVTVVWVVEFELVEEYNDN